MVRRTATLALGALMLAACAHASSTPPALSYLRAQVPSCTDTWTTQRDNVWVCLPGDGHLYLATSYPDEPTARLAASLYATDQRARAGQVVDTGQVAGQWVSIVAASLG